MKGTKNTMPKGIRNNSNEATERAIAYLHGRIESQLEHYAGAIGTSPEWLAERVATLLLTAGPGLVNSMPNMRKNTPKGSSALEPLAMANNAYRNGSQAGKGSKTGKADKGKVRRLTPEGRKAISGAAKARWANAKKSGKAKPKVKKTGKVHWTQTPAGRAKIVAQNKAMWAARKAANKG